MILNESSRVRRRLRRPLKDTYHRLRLRSAGPPEAVLVVIGCQRSGTTMLLRAFDRDWEVKVFPEFSRLNAPAAQPSRFPFSRGHTGIRLKPNDELSTEIGRLRYPAVMMKPLADSQRAPAILETIDAASCIWMFRHYRDVAESIARTFSSDVHVRNLGPIVRNESDNWRSELVAEDVRATIAEHYSPSMDPCDGGALFWYARNRIYFDLGLDREPRVIRLRYEDLVANPVSRLASIYDQVGMRRPNRSIAREIHREAVGKGSTVEISAEIAAVCDDLWRRLNSPLRT